MRAAYRVVPRREPRGCEEEHGADGPPTFTSILQDTEGP